MLVSLILIPGGVSSEGEAFQTTYAGGLRGMRTLIIGCGYVGRHLGEELVRQGHQVWGLQRTRSRRMELEETGIKPLTADITKPETLTAVNEHFDWIVNCVSASGGGAPEYRQVYVQGMRNLVRWLADRPPRRFVYTGSTSVYAQADGSRVDETSPTEPTVPTGQALVEAEKTLLEASQQSGFPGIVLRVAGIYGPGRGYWIKQYLSGEARIEGNGQRILNMIHRDDVAGAIICALSRGREGQIYNVVDDEPVEQRVCLEWLGSRLGRGFPVCVAEDPDTDRKRGITNKRVSNRKLKTDIGYRFIYPTFRQGFEAELQRLGFPVHTAS